ncbi:MAG: ABC transporter substrate-binding protein [Firmicutes bacterium]|nr:ABC transporter substrate-binding protein [Bacillota bacterium]
MKKLFTLMMALMMVLALASCGGDDVSGNGDVAGYPMTVTDGIGTTMTIESEPEKIVSLSPSCTEILYALGLGDKMVGVSTWCTYPEEALQVEQVGDTYSVNIERIIEMEADIVFVSGHAGADAIEILTQTGIPVYCTSTVTLDDIYQNILDMGTVTNTADTAKAITDDMKADLESLQAEVADLESRSLFIDLGDLYSTSKEDYLGKSLELVKIDNVALDFDYGSPRVSAETVIEKNPDVYIAMCAEKDFVMTDGFDQLNAFKNGEVHYIEYGDPRTDMITRDGPRFVEGLRELVKLVHQTETK